MKFSLKYLLKFIEHLDFNIAKIDITKISEQLRNLGLEVESCIHNPADHNDYILEIASAPNRADLLSIIGIARELAVINNAKLKLPDLKDDAADLLLDTYDQNKLTTVNITVTVPEACPKYLSRVFLDINQNKTTPQWIQEVLNIAEIKLISPVVDIANYVMFELGQPLHAFDLTKIKNNTTNKTKDPEIIIRKAKNNEELILLDNNKILLNNQDLIIADPEKPLAIAGVMGGLSSAINAETRDLLIECAYFDPISIRMTARRHNLITDASQRFTRNIDPNLQHIAMLRVSELLQETVGGALGPIVSIINNQFLPKETIIVLSRAKIKNVLGSCVPDATVELYLNSLEMNLVKKHNVGWEVTVPSWRPDLKIQEDLIEDIARFIGYDNILRQQLSLPLSFKSSEQNLSFNNLNLNNLNLNKELEYKNCLVNRGYYETINYSFIDPELAKLFNPEQQFYTLKNPMSQSMSVMRASLWPGLITALLYNQNRQQTRIRLFEIGTVFLYDANSNQVEQSKKLAGLVSGNLLAENWQHLNQKVDFFAVKSDVEAILNYNQHNAQIMFKPINKNYALHTLQAAEIYLDNVLVGVIGALHPNIVKKLSIIAPVFLFELDLALIAKCNIPKFADFSKFPSIRRDFSIVIDATVSCDAIKQIVQTSCEHLLKHIIFFDVYSGDKLPKNKKSLAFGVILQHLTKTLESAEIANIEANIILSLEKIGATLRANLK